MKSAVWLKARSLVLKDGQEVVLLEDALEAIERPLSDSRVTVERLRDYMENHPFNWTYSGLAEAARPPIDKRMAAMADAFRDHEWSEHRATEPIDGECLQDIMTRYQEALDG